MVIIWPITVDRKNGKNMTSFWALLRQRTIVNTKMIWNGYENTDVLKNLVAKKMNYVMRRIMNLWEIPAKDGLLNSAQGTICTVLSLRSERVFFCFPIKRLGASVARTACKTWERKCSRIWFSLRGQAISRARLTGPGVEYLHHYPRAGVKRRF